ncbi:unnamed protein product [Somion occarium]|uniref:RNase H type-1 domain-containing protein n=1 Tax=Somion occarium TaxID=3059160 RepID=A0ABP1D475_9APHY
MRIWTAFDSLILWIALVLLHIDQFNYVDDNFRFEEEGCIELYQPYNAYSPSNQTKLLHLWDDINLPHECRKQEYGHTLTIIGFQVDPNLMTVTLPSESLTKLIRSVEDFLVTFTTSRRHTLTEFQQLTSYINWSFNIFPLLKPALSNMYAKMSGKTHCHAGIYLNCAITSDLQWFLHHVHNFDGIHLFQTLAWSPSDLIEDSHRDEFALVDASSSSIGLYFPWSHLGFWSELPCHTPTSTIYFFEALAICAAIHRIHFWRTASHFVQCLAILSDNTNAVHAFNTLKVTPPYNPILTSAIDIMIEGCLQVRVDHINGEDNQISDTLSRGQLDQARLLNPKITILHFTPPRDALGAVKK